MKILFCGDVVGKAGRKVIIEHIPQLRRRLGLDFVIVNGENAAHGFGITEKICKSFFDAGVDVITTGNHAWDQREIADYIGTEPRLLRPLNYVEGTPGNGSGLFKARDGKRVLVVHPMGLLFMRPLDDPFKGADAALAKYQLGVTADCIFVDMHGEATSEKVAMGHYLDGRVSAVVGTHSHIPTADTQILTGGTAFQTDAGMCGDYDSVIGMNKETAVGRFIDPANVKRLEPANNAATLCGFYVETDDDTGLARVAAPLRTGGCLAETWPA